MGPHASDSELCLHEFSKSLSDKAYSWYITIPAGLIESWEDMLECFCGKYYQEQKEVTLICLHNTKQRTDEDLLDYIRRFRDKALECHVKYEEHELVEICIDNMFSEYKIHLENLEIKQFSMLLRKAHKTAAYWKTNERTWKTSERSKTDNRNAPQVLLVAANEPASKKREKSRAVEEYLPIPCTSEELSVILDWWIADGVVKLYKIDREPTKEDKKHSRFCRYHRYVHHTTLEFRYIRRMFHEKLADGTLGVGRGTQGVQRNPLPQYDRGKGIVAVVIHASDEEEDPMISATLTPTAIKTLQRSLRFVFCSTNGINPQARMAATEAIVDIASLSGSHCFTAEAHVSRAFLETTKAVTFTDEDMEVKYPDHKRPLYVSAMINEVHVRRALVDTGSSLNILPLSTLVAASIFRKKIQGMPMEITGFEEGCEHTIGHIQLVLNVRSLVGLTRFHVFDSSVSYHLLLGRSWLHKHKLILSTYHQCVKGPLNGKPIRVPANPTPFD